MRASMASAVRLSGMKYVSASWADSWLAAFCTA